MKKTVVISLLLAACNLFPATAYAADVTVTLPAGTDTTLYPGGDSGVVNEDGTITFSLDKKMQKEWKKSIKEAFDDSVKEFMDDDVNYPSLVDLKCNEDMTEFTLAYNGELTFQESMMYTLFPYWVAPLYQQVCGVPEDKIDYKLICTDESTKEESVSNYRDALEMVESFNMTSTPNDSQLIE